MTPLMSSTLTGTALTYGVRRRNRPSASYQKRAATRTGSAGDSEFTRMQEEYAAYRSFRIQEQALFELAEAFDGEARPTVIRTQDQVFRLRGPRIRNTTGADIALIETGGQAL